MNYKCDNCSKQAVEHYQVCYVRWDIINDEIDLTTQEFISGDDSEFYCEDCG